MKREIGMAYGAADEVGAGSATRITYVIGPDGKIVQAHPKVSAKGHPREILGLL